jgi:hypothetical protein
MTFFRRHMRARGCRVAILGAILSGTLIVSALAQTASRARRSTTVSAGTMALPPTLHSCFLAWRYIRSFPACSADTGRTASRSSSNWSSS